MKRWGILVHGRFDFRSQPDSVIEKMGRDLAAAGYDVTTLNCDQMLEPRIMEAWQFGDEVVMAAFSNGCPEAVGIAKDFEDRSSIVVQRMVLMDPVQDGFGQIPLWPFHKDIFVPLNVKECVVYMRGHADLGRVKVNDQITIVHLLSDAFTDHPRVPELAMPEALALLQGGAIPDVSVPVPGQETVA